MPSERPWWLTPLIIVATALAASFLTSVAIGAMEQLQYLQSQQDKYEFDEEAAAYLTEDTDDE